MIRPHAIAMLAVLCAACSPPPEDGLAQKVRIEAGAIPASLTGRPGDPARGRALFVDRDGGHCVLCHAVAGLDAEFQGNIGPDLTGIDARLSEGQIRLRIVDAQRVWPETVMPSYFRVGGLQQVARDLQGRPALSADQIEDLVAFLSDPNIEPDT